MGLAQMVGRHVVCALSQRLLTANFDFQRLRKTAGVRKAESGTWKANRRQGN